ncbi:NAD(P)H-hydrate dehydratase [Halobacillus salinarum]|uniref:Bifunctional NAD(P)H-hydrate repair enzyme n=1 Tax=Halobacillus salinarum TaxID=2932257 RepID=A0ABY4EJX9_9BACI|nr:NAD(P)H-hydrate dehydratase [Halobacillus salinarum]UOQ44352.1 NAD(P)H-hydrate dehydratase [Halobacillus salinarum]
MEIVTAQEMYDWDQLAIQSAGIEGKVLMESAGREAARAVEGKVERHDRILVLIGAGNNGGDGFVLARTLLNRGYHVQAWQVVPDEKISGDALLHKEIYSASNYPLLKLEDWEEFTAAMQSADVLVDAMLGIGANGPLRSPLKEIVELANQQSCCRIAVDLPTGVPADEGVVDFDGFRADHTIVIAALKMSAFLQHTRPYYGEVEVVEIGLPVKYKNKGRRVVWQADDVKRTLPKRGADSHKGSHGRGLIIGGSYSMPGSIAVSAKAALRSGAGLVTVATAKSAIPSVSSYVQEATFLPMNEKDGAITGHAVEDFQQFDGVAVGMGIGRNSEVQELMSELLAELNVPLLIDADGLYQVKELLEDVEVRSAPIVLTPHPGEFAHLTGEPISKVMQSPFAYSKEFACSHGVYLVLKGPATIITSPEGDQRVDVSGNAGLAKGGTGDVLSGILLAMMLQSESFMDGLCNGCFIHGSTAELLTEASHSKTGLLATDVIEGLSQSFRIFS